MARSLKPLLHSFETRSDWNGRKPSCFYNMFCVRLWQKTRNIRSLKWCFAQCANSGVFCSLSAVDTKKTWPVFLWRCKNAVYCIYIIYNKWFWYTQHQNDLGKNLSLAPDLWPSVCLLLSQILAHLGGQLLLNLALVPGAVDDKHRVLLQVTCHVLTGGRGRQNIEPKVWPNDLRVTRLPIYCFTLAHSSLQVGHIETYPFRDQKRASKLRQLTTLADVGMTCDTIHGPI